MLPVEVLENAIQSPMQTMESFCVKLAFTCPNDKVEASKKVNNVNVNFILFRIS